MTVLAQIINTNHKINAHNVDKFWWNLEDLARCILPQTWAYIKLWGQTIDINTFYIQYELANVNFNQMYLILSYLTILFSEDWKMDKVF